MALPSVVGLVSMVVEIVTTCLGQRVGTAGQGRRLLDGTPVKVLAS